MSQKCVNSWRLISNRLIYKGVDRATSRLGRPRPASQGRLHKNPRRTQKFYTENFTLGKLPTRVPFKKQAFDSDETIFTQSLNQFQSAESPTYTGLPAFPKNGVVS